MEISDTIELIKNFGFPIAIACWALWRLDKNWGKGDGISHTLSSIEDTLDRIESSLDHRNQLQQEMVTSIKIIQSILSSQGGGIKKE